MIVEVITCFLLGEEREEKLHLEGLEEGDWYIHGISSSSDDTSFCARTPPYSCHLNFIKCVDY